MSVCGCDGDHSGTNVANKIFDISVDYLYDCLFSYNEVYSSFTKKRKIKDLVIGTWETKVDEKLTYRLRNSSNSVELGVFYAMKDCKNVFEEVCVFFN